MKFAPAARRPRLLALPANEIAVMQDGEIVERATASELILHPVHPRTAELVAASLALSLRGALA